MARKKTNWDKLRNRNYEDTTQYRDVYGDQQLDRSRIEEKQSMLSRNIGTAIVSILVVVLVYSLISFGAKFVDTIQGSMDAAKIRIETVHSVEVQSFVDEWVETPVTGSYPKYISAITGEEKTQSDYKSELKGLQELHPGTKAYFDENDLEITEEEYELLKASDSNKYFYPTLSKVFISLFVGLMVAGIMYQILKRNLVAQNLMSDTSDINQYQNDQHVALPEELHRKFDWFPDVGAKASPSVSSMISHVAISNKGLKKIEVAKRAEKDIVDENGDIMYYEGEILLDEDGEPITEMMPIIDTDFMNALFDASKLPKEKALRKFVDTTQIEYLPNDKRERVGDYETIAELINNDWEFPLYEPQRPAGAYLVDTAPVNTMVLAITRAGKGQTVIEPTLDMWLREKNPHNMVVNDPKGELLVKHYVRATVRGFEVVQFNLINAMKTDIYNPLGMAAEAAREGDFTKCAQYVENIADVFFPLDGGDDPVWPNAANNAFKRAAYGLIDYYLEEEAELRLKAERTNMDDAILESQIDALWGKVTLYNCYQLFVQLTSKKMPNPLADFLRKEKSGAFANMDEDEVEELKYEAAAKGSIWEDKPEADCLTLYFTATEMLPKNGMRNLVMNANNALKAMAGAEKMMASVYGIAITAMSFFTDPTISTLTSGTPSQNVDLGGLSFPRRMGVRFHSSYMTKYHFAGMQARWRAYSDKNYEHDLGKDFFHNDLVSREGWARYYFKGKFPSDTAYLKLEIVNPQSDMLMRTFYFRFKKAYQKSLDGRHYVKDPILGEKIPKNGTLVEMRPFKDTKTGEFVYKKAKTTFPQEKILDIDMSMNTETVETPAILAYQARYSEKPKMVFLVTPPHLMKYAKLILILIKQLVDLNFERSYMTKENQKPLYKTRFMLDELGNLQSEGHGISGFSTMLSIGLGQEQQFTLILQTLQQLRDVYGDSADKIIQGNAQPLTARIATPTGWKLMGDIQVGDEVLTPYGTVTTVTGVYPKGVRPVYSVELRDGSKTESCDEHLWNVNRWKSSIRYTGVCSETGKRMYEGSNDGKTCTLVEEIIDTNELKRRVDKNMNVSLPEINPVEYDVADLPIDPYVFGAIMGDGHIQKNGVVKFTSADSDIIAEISRRGYDVVPDTVDGEPKDGIGYRINGVNKIMRDLGLAGKRSWEKVIPDMYLYGSVEQRIDLLRGLMDTDGTISEANEMEYTSVSVDLAIAVQTIIRSLGGRVAINVKTNVMYTAPNQKEPKAGRVAYRVQNINLHKINPFNLSRKASRWHERTDTSGNRVVSVKYLRDDEVQCIRVADERHMYITDDFMPTHNTSNIVFLKSTDDSMLDTLQKMSGITHRAVIDAKTITRDTEKMFMKNEGKTSYTMSTREVPVITYNDMAFIPERNSIIFRAGDAPIWNRNEAILPMSFRLFSNTITQPGKEYSLQTIPTLSSALDFDVRKNQPDFMKMLAKRMEQAYSSQQSQEAYAKGYGLNEYQISQLDPDDYSSDIMTMINAYIRRQAGIDDTAEYDDDDFLDEDEALREFYENQQEALEENLEDNDEQAEANRIYSEKRANDSVKIYADGQIARENLVKGNFVLHTLDKEIVDVYIDVRGDMQRDTDNFIVRGNDLLGLDGTEYIIKQKETDELKTLNEAAENEEDRVFSESNIDETELRAIGTYIVKDAFIRFLASRDVWDFGKGRFEELMARKLRDI